MKITEEHIGRTLLLETKRYSNIFEYKLIEFSPNKEYMKLIPGESKHCVWRKIDDFKIVDDFGVVE